MAGEQTKFTTSFIPKKPVTPTVSGYKPASSNFLSIITIAIFLGVVIAAGGLFAYKLTVQKQIDLQIAELKKAREQFDENLIKESNRLNARLGAVKKLIDAHQAPTAVLDLFQDSTLSTVRFTNFKYSTDKTKNVINVEASGVGVGYQSIVLQSDEFGKTTLLKDLVFSSVQPNDTGLVSFSMKSILDSSVVLYRRSLVADEGSNSQNDVSVNNFFR